MRAVTGQCPMGCGETLLLLPNGTVVCGYVRCLDSTAMAAIMADRETEHLVKIDDAGTFIGLVHPLRERVRASILDCELVEAVVVDMQNGNAPTDGGRYRVVYVGLDPDSAGLRDPLCSWERIT